VRAEAVRLLVVGSINQDLVVRVDHLPGPGQTALGDRFERHGGGKGANQAVAAARAGAEVTLVAAVGDDDLGREALADLAREGVQTDRVEVIGAMATGVAIIAVDRNGENQIAIAPGANMSLQPRHVIRLLEEGPAFHACLVSLEIPDEVVAAAVTGAAIRRIPVVLNPAPARTLAESVLDAAPVLVPNEDELQALTGEVDVPSAGRQLFNRTGAPVVITRGSRGATLVEQDRVTELPAHQVRALDATGAGDTFAAWLAVGVARAQPIRTSVERANVAAALSTTRPGARGGMPRGSELEAAPR
jgi:ribokinase